LDACFFADPSFSSGIAAAERVSTGLQVVQGQGERAVSETRPIPALDGRRIRPRDKVHGAACLPLRPSPRHPTPPPPPTPTDPATRTSLRPDRRPRNSPRNEADEAVPSEPSHFLPSRISSRLSYPNSPDGHPDDAHESSTPRCPRPARQHRPLPRELRETRNFPAFWPFPRC